MTFKQLLQTISKKEWRWVLILALILITLTSVPYIYAYLNTPGGYFYNGLHALTPGDVSVYFSYINQIKAGHWLLQDYFTSEAQTGGLFNIIWLVIGLLAKLFNLSAPLAWQISRLVLIPVFLAVIYIFISYFWAEKNKRLLTFLFACFASGIGAYFALALEKIFYASLPGYIYKWPIDLWMPEANIFLTIYHSPYLMVSVIMLMLSFLFLLLALSNNDYRYSVMSGILGLIWFNFHPYYFPYFFLIFGIYLAILILKNKKNYGLIWHFLLCLVLSAPSIIYHYYKIKTDLVIGARAGLNISLTPPLIFVFLGFGFILISALLGLYFQARKKELWYNDNLIFLAVWLISGLALLYCPISFARRFAEGLEIPMLIFTIAAIWEIKAFLILKFHKTHDFLKGNYALLIFLFLILFGFSTLFNVLRDIVYFQEHYYKYYIPLEYQAAADWLQENNADTGAILSNEFSGSLLPSLTNLHVYIGHDQETIYYEEKSGRLAEFWNNKYEDQAALEFFKKYGISYILYSDTDRKYFAYQAEQKQYLAKVWQQGQLEIYKVKY